MQQIFFKLNSLSATVAGHGQFTENSVTLTVQSDPTQRRYELVALIHRPGSRNSQQQKEMLSRDIVVCSLPNYYALQSAIFKRGCSTILKVKFSCSV